MPTDTVDAPEADDTTETTNTDPGGQRDDDQAPEWARREIEKARKEARNLRARLKEAEPLAKRATELEDAAKSEQQKLAERAEQAERRVAELELQTVRERVARAHGLADWADRLRGDTEDEITADAEALAARVGARAPGVPAERLQSGTVPVDKTESVDPDAWIRNAVAARAQHR